MHGPGRSVVVSPAEENIIEPQSDTWTLTPFQNTKETKRVYKKMKDTDNSCSKNDDTNEKNKPVGDNPSRHFDKTSVSTSSAETPKTKRSEVDWPKQVLRQCILVSRISAEIMNDIDKVDWNENCYKECRQLLLQESMQLGDVLGGRGVEKISGLAGWEMLRWTADALEQAKRASRFVEDRIVKIGAERAAREEEQARRRLGVPIPTAENARRIVLDAARKDPISDSHMEILVRATLPKKPILPWIRVDKTATAGVSLAKRSGSGDTAQTFETAIESAYDNQLKGKTDTEDESAARYSKGVRVENPLLVLSDSGNTPSDRQLRNRP